MEAEQSPPLAPSASPERSLPLERQALDMRSMQDYYDRGAI
jgi:hypothetical protein